MSDEEDGLGLTALRATSSKLPPVSRAGGNRAKSKPYPKELRKTVAALAIMCLNFVLTTASLSGLLITNGIFISVCSFLVKLYAFGKDTDFLSSFQ